MYLPEQPLSEYLRELNFPKNNKLQVVIGNLELSWGPLDSIEFRRGARLDRVARRPG
jgi:hypothetical protein